MVLKTGLKTELITKEELISFFDEVDSKLNISFLLALPKSIFKTQC